MAWGKAGSTTLASAGDVITSSDMTGSNFNMVLTHQIATGNLDNIDVTLNNNTNNVYADRECTNGGSEYTQNTQPAWRMSHGNAAWDYFNVNYICSITGEEKLLIGFFTSNNGTGNTVPHRNEHVAKFVPSPDAPVTRIDFTNTSGSGSYDTGSNLTVLGSDITPAAAITFPTDVQEGSRAEITDTRKMYNYTSPSITYSSDFSTSTGWTTSDSGAIAVDTTNQDISWTVSRGTNDSISYDLTSVSDSAWILRWRTRWSTIGDSSQNQQWFGISSLDYSNAHNVAQDFLGIMTLKYTAGSATELISIESDGTTLPASGDASNNTGRSTNTWYYYEIKRTSATSFEVSISSTNSYTKDIYDSGSITCDSTISGLRYIKLLNENAGTGSDGTACENKDFKFWNGVTSTTDNYWQEIGT